MDDALRSRLKSNIESVRERIYNAALRSGRDPSEIKLVGVTKTVDTDTARAAAGLGLADIGENHAQEYVNKRILINECGISIHFIGQLQRNKVKYILDDVDLIHSVDRLPLAEEIQSRAATIGKRIPVLIQVGFGTEENRGGVSPDELPRLAEKILAMPELSLRGLMTVPPVDPDIEGTRNCFKELFRLRGEFIRQGIDMPELSMGMSHDFETAVEEGATIVRVGTSIFGARHYD